MFVSWPCHLSAVEQLQVTDHQSASKKMSRHSGHARQQSTLVWLFSNASVNQTRMLPELFNLQSNPCWGFRGAKWTGCHWGNKLCFKKDLCLGYETTMVVDGILKIEIQVLAPRRHDACLFLTTWYVLVCTVCTLHCTKHKKYQIRSVIINVPPVQDQDLEFQPSTSCSQRC